MTRPAVLHYVHTECIEEGDSRDTSSCTALCAQSTQRRVIHVARPAVLHYAHTEHTEEGDSCDTSSCTALCAHRVYRGG